MGTNRGNFGGRLIFQVTLTKKKTDFRNHSGPYTVFMRNLVSLFHTVHLNKYKFHLESGHRNDNDHQ